MNKVVLMGRLTADPELKTTATGLSVVTFSVASDRNFSKSATEKQTDFFDVVAWRQTAEFVCKYFRKGQMILVCGSLQTRTYVDKNGSNHKVVELVADSVHFTGSKAESGAISSSYGASYNPGNEYQQPAQPSSQPQPAYSNGSDSDFINNDILSDDDLPF